MEHTDHAVKLLVAVVDRGQGEHAAALLKQGGALYHLICLGRGTANSEILDYLGPVSYTHLDVYKRQPDKQAPESDKMKRPSRPIRQRQNPRRAGRMTRKTGTNPAPSAGTA